MDEIPELNENKKNITHLNGEIEFKNVSFRYNENSELDYYWVLKNHKVAVFFMMALTSKILT